MDGSWAIEGDFVRAPRGTAKIVAGAGDWIQIKYIDGSWAGHEDIVKVTEVEILPGTKNQRRY